MSPRAALTVFLFPVIFLNIYGQTTPDTQTQQPAPQQEPPAKRAFGIIPTNSVANASDTDIPITVRQKFAIGAKDSLDYTLIFLCGGLAGLGQMTNQNPSYGQGISGYAKRMGALYVDQAVGNMMTESIFPSLLHQDPRYFRRGVGSTRSRIWYAASRVLITRTDSGARSFNYSEFLGNATAVAP